tara:strand:+ start:943 stop:1203 length:261 start_codon:yes stop_codon:yes gene_type:complete
MYTPLFDNSFAESIFPQMRTVYVVSDSQLEELKRRRNQEELDNLSESRKRLEANYQSHLKILDEREDELKKEIKAFGPECKERDKT